MQSERADNTEPSFEHADHVRLLREFMRDRDIRCPVCAYSLRNCTSVQCPECGTEIELRIGPATLRMRWWVTTLVALLLPLGLGLMLTAFMVPALIISPTNDPEEWYWTLGTFVVTSVNVILVVVTIVRRRRFLRRRVGTQKFLALIALLYPLSVCALVAYWIYSLLTFF